MANIQLCASGVFSLAPAALDAIDESVSPRCTTCVLPPAAEASGDAAGPLALALRAWPLCRAVGADVSAELELEEEDAEESPAAEAVAADGAARSGLGAGEADADGATSRAIEPSRLPAP